MSDTKVGGESDMSQGNLFRNTVLKNASRLVMPCLIYTCLIHSQPSLLYIDYA